MAPAPWHKFVFGLLILAYFLYFNWDHLWVRFAADDMMNMSIYWGMAPVRVLLGQFLPWTGAFRPMAGLFYMPLFKAFGLNPLPYHAVMLAILLANLYLVYRFARRIGCGELQAGLATLILAYHAGLSMLYYNTAFIYDVLCFSFYIAAFLCYAHVRARGRLLRGGEKAAVMGLYLGALNSKEMALTLPIVLLAYECFYHPFSVRRLRELVAWVRGPGSVTLYCGLLNLLYLYGKAAGPNSLMRSAGYRPVLSLHRVLAFETTAMSDLFMKWDTFNWRHVVVMWAIVAYLAWRRPRPVMRFSWFFLMLTPLPLALLEGRGAACLYIPLAGWAVFASVVLTDLASALARLLTQEPLFRRAGYSALFALIVCASLFFWAQQNDYLKRTFVRGSMTDLGKQTGEVIRQMSVLNPRVKPGSHVVFLNDPFDGWDMNFIAQLWFRDRSLHFHLQRKTPLPAEELAKMTVFDFQNGRLVQR